jgi:hypothetical protein
LKESVRKRKEKGNSEIIWKKMEGTGKMGTVKLKG